MAKDLLTILHEEVKPALGCTGPISVSFAVSVAKDAVGGKPKSVRVIMDKDTYKNSISVGIPGTTMRGLEISAALGLLGDSKAGLEVLRNITPEDEATARTLLKSTAVEIIKDHKGIGLHIEAFVETDKGEGHAIVSEKHDNVNLIEVNGEKIFESVPLKKVDEIDSSKDDIRKYNLEKFYDFAKAEPIDKLNFLREAIRLNRVLSNEGMKEGIGAGFGQAYKSFEPNTLVIKAKSVTAAACDARMAGLDFPAMSCTTSGNVGIGASLPLVVVAEELERSEEELLRAIALSFLLTIYTKSHIGRLSAICACIIAASLGTTAGTVLLLGGKLAEIEKAINNVVGAIGGVICDGAKFGCSLKLASGVGVALESAFLAMKGVSIPPRDGVVCDCADETIHAIGRIAKEGMATTPEVLLDILMKRQKITSR